MVLLFISFEGFSEWKFGIRNNTTADDDRRIVVSKNKYGRSEGCT